MDSGNGYEYTMTPHELKVRSNALYGKSATRANLPVVVFSHIAFVIALNGVSPDKRGEMGAYNTYIQRIYAVPHYGEKSGTEILKLICRCAFHDNVLTEDESISIINICHSPEWHRIFMEANFNEGWN